MALARPVECLGRMDLRALLLGTSIALSASPAAAYNVNLDSTGAPVRWPDGVVTLAVHEAPASFGVPRPQQLRAAERAAQTWSDALHGAVEVAVVGAPGAGAPGYDEREGARNASTVTFADGEWPYDERLLAVTVITIDVKRHAIVDADIVVRTDKRWDLLDHGHEGGPRRHDLQNALTHELGHLVGLQHSVAAPEVVMYPGTVPGETQKRTLADDDRDGAAYLYGGGVPSPDLPELLGASCAAAGAGASLVPSLAVVAALALLARRSARRFAPAVAIAVAALPGLALADDAPEPAVVVHGLVVETRTFRVSGSFLITTESVIEVKGCTASCEERVVVRQPGGRIGDLEQIVSGSTPLRAGDEVVAVIRPIERDLRRRDGRRLFRIEGLDEGLIRVRSAFAPPAAPEGANLTTDEGSEP